jgi:hypothetical protein
VNMKLEEKPFTLGMKLILRRGNSQRPIGLTILNGLIDMIKTITNVLDDLDFVQLKKYLLSFKSRYQEYDMGSVHCKDRQPLYALPVPERFNRLLTEVLNKDPDVGPHRDILTFARLNTPIKNTQFRIHADSKIFDTQPNLAAVFYMQTDDSSTAFFEHPIYGKRATPENQIFTVDDGQWKIYHQQPSIENTMLIYDSQLYHGRQPWKVNFDRVVVVKFLSQEVTHEQ